MDARQVGTGSPRLVEGSEVADRHRSCFPRRVALVLAALAVATLALAARADAYVYWTDAAKDTIGRANLDGTGVDRSFIRGLVHPEAIAVDTTHGYLYWVNANPCCTSDPGGTIGRANLDGTGVDPDFISGIGSPHGVAVDGAHVYWDDTHTTVTPTGSVSDFAIGRANLDGTGVDQGFIEPGGGNGLAVDDAHVYWSVATWINRANLNGTGAEYGFIDLQRIDTVMYEIAVNGSHIYWIGNVGPSRNAIGRANLDGSRVTNKLITGFNPFGGSDPTGLALDALGPPPSNEFGVRGVKVNRKGSAKLTVKVAGPGELELAKTGSVKGQRKRAAQSGKAKLTVKAKGKAKKRLNKRGKTTVKAKVTYTPDGGTSDTKSKTIKLVKR